MPMPADKLMVLSRRGLIGSGVALAALPLLEACAGKGGHGKALVVGLSTEPTTLTCSFTSAGVAQFISPKIFDGLLTYTPDLKPLPRLAQAWHFDETGHTLTLQLRPGVRWHDGKPFTSGDVAFSALQVWKLYHSRGRMTFAHLTAVDTPDPLTAIFRFSEPSPYVLSALGANESQVVPRHLYEGRDVIGNPANLRPVGTGPFRFAEWQTGQFIRLERNPDYWTKGLPQADGVIFRLLSDGAAQAAALETGEIDLTRDIAPGDFDRLARLPNLRQDKRPFALSSAGSGIEFNLDNPRLQDVRVRRAVAHAVDKHFILQTILRGDGVIDKGPISSLYPAFYSDDLPGYPFDPARAIALLEEAGLKPDARGIRLSFRLFSIPGTPASAQVADYVRSALAKVGIEARIEKQDFASFVKKVYTDRNFDVVITGGQMGPDPVIGTQRWYWSKSFKPGVAFSNGSHYHSAQADHFLEEAQREVDPVRRKALYAQFSRVVMTDLPRIPLYSTSYRLFSNSRVSPLPDTAEGYMGSFADVKLSA